MTKNTPNAPRSALVSCAIAAIFALAPLAPPAPPARAELEIDITQGNVDPLPIAVLSFQIASDLKRAPDAQLSLEEEELLEQEANMAQEIRDVIAGDLKRSGLFKLLNPEIFAEKPDQIGEIPRFADWRAIKADAIIVGNIAPRADGSWNVSFRLWDTYAEEQMIGFQYVATLLNKRRIGHIIADAIYQRLTGESGYFNTRIVFVEETGPKNNRVKRLSIMDQDGYEPQPLTDGEDLVITPRFSPTLQELTYVSWVDSVARVHLHNVTKNIHEIVGDFKGMTFAPRFTPDGNHLIMSLARGGNTDLYKMRLGTRELQPLTNTAAIDTAPSYSPDGKYIAFESDRGGSQQIYVMSADGTNVRRITFGEGAYGTPVWSPRGDLIAFTKTYQGRFLIGVIRPDGTGERILTSGYHNEGPTWSPNGRVILFFRDTPGEQGGPSIWSVDLTGYNEQKLSTPGFASDPAWSPLLEGSDAPS